MQTKHSRAFTLLFDERAIISAHPMLETRRRTMPAALHRTMRPQTGKSTVQQTGSELSVVAAPAALVPRNDQGALLTVNAD